MLWIIGEYSDKIADTEGILEDQIGEEGEEGGDSVHSLASLRGGEHGWHGKRADLLCLCGTHTAPPAPAITTHREQHTARALKTQKVLLLAVRAAL